MTTWRAAATVAVCPCEFLDRSVFLDGDVYERLTNIRFLGCSRLFRRQGGGVLTGS